MTPCTCPAPGYCPARGREVSSMGFRVCRGGNEAAIERYFRGGTTAARPARREVAPTSGPINCVYLGGPVRGADGGTATKLCPTCRGNVRLKLYECHHPGHAASPVTTDKDCRACRDYSTRRIEPEIVMVGGDPVMNHWRGGAG